MDVSHCLNCGALIWGCRGDHDFLCENCIPANEPTPCPTIQAIDAAVRTVAWRKPKNTR